MAEVKAKLWNSQYLKVLGGNFFVNFSFMLIAPLLPLYLQDTFGTDKDTIGLVLSGYTITALIIRLFSGYIVDTFPRKTVLVISTFIFAACFSGYLAAGSLIAFAIVRTLHGAPMGLTGVGLSTVAIDVLPSSRRTEGIGFYGLSNNISTAISPTVALFIFSTWHSYRLLFVLSLIVAMGSALMAVWVKVPEKEQIKNKQKISFDRFILVKGWSEGLTLMCFGFAYGVISTYIAVYGRDVLGITGGTGLFFALFAGGLILSRLTGSVSLRKGLITRNASVGIVVAIIGYFIFAAFHNPFGYYGCALVVGLGNGHMYPAFQNMFINLASNDQRGTANSTLQVAWDVGLGIGILLGGVISHHFSFSEAFWMAFGINLIGAALYFLYSRNHYLKNKLR